MCPDEAKRTSDRPRPIVENTPWPTLPWKSPESLLKSLKQTQDLDTQFPFCIFDQPQNEFLSMPHDAKRSVLDPRAREEPE